MQSCVLIEQNLLIKLKKTVTLIKSIFGPLAKLDKALGYEPGDSRFEFWAVHQKRIKMIDWLLKASLQKSVIYFFIIITLLLLLLTIVL